MEWNLGMGTGMGMEMAIRTGIRQQLVYKASILDVKSIGRSCANDGVFTAQGPAAVELRSRNA